MYVCMYELYVFMYVSTYASLVLPQSFFLCRTSAFLTICVRALGHVAAVALRLAGASALPVSSLLCEAIPA